MSVPIKVNIVPEDHPIRSHLPMVADYICLHETANVNDGAGDEMHAIYILGDDAIRREVLWHATVDDDSVTQHLPFNEVGWHAGDGYHGPGNRTSIGIELAVNSDGDFEQTQRNAAWFIAHHIIKAGLVRKPFPECMVQHHHWKGKDCPHFIRATPGGWDAFLRMIADELHPPRTVTHNGEVVQCAPTDVDGTTRVDLRPVLEMLKGRVLTRWWYDEPSNTVHVESRPERAWWRFLPI